MHGMRGSFYPLLSGAKSVVFGTYERAMRQPVEQGLQAQETLSGRRQLYLSLIVVRIAPLA
jgi:hypothetical protein